MVNREVLDGGDSPAIHAGAARKCGRVLCGPIPTWVSHELRTNVSAQTILADLEAQGTGPGAFGLGMWARCRKWYLALKVLRYAQTTVCKAVSRPGVSQNQGGGNRVYLLQSDNLTFRKK